MSELSNIEKLCQKMDEEQAAFRSRLLKMKREEILNHAYEFGIREELRFAPKSCVLSDEDVQTLLETPDALGKLFEAYRDDPGYYLDGVEKIAGYCAQKLRDEAQQESQIEQTREQPAGPR